MYRLWIIDLWRNSPISEMLTDARDFDFQHFQSFWAPNRGACGLWRAVALLSQLAKPCRDQNMTGQVLNRQHIDVTKKISLFLFGRHSCEVSEEDIFKAFEGTCLGTAKIENSGVFLLGKIRMMYRSVSACLY